MLRRVPVVASILLLLGSAAARAQDRAAMPTLNSAIRGQWVQFNIVVGRIMLQNSPVGPIDTGPNTASRKDHLSIQAENGETALVYEGANNKEQFNIDACGNSRLTLRRVPKNDPQAIAVEFRQEPRGKSVLLLGPEGKQQILAADSLWHLFLLYPEQSRKHLAPLLQTLQPNWRLAETADAIERALGHNGDVAVSYDRANWGRWVAQLGDENFARREAADRELCGEPGTLGFSAATRFQSVGRRAAVPHAENHRRGFGADQQRLARAGRLLALRRCHGLAGAADSFRRFHAARRGETTCRAAGVSHPGRSPGRSRVAGGAIRKAPPAGRGASASEKD